MDESTQAEMLCRCCSCVIENEDDIVWINDLPYCQDCTFQCERCYGMELVENQHLIGPDGDVMVCNECFNNEVSLCSICEHYEFTNDLEDVDGCLVCTSCMEDSVTTCELCDEHHLDDNMVEIYDGQSLCKWCATEEGYTEECQECSCLAKPQDLMEYPAGINEALKMLIKLADYSTEFNEPVKVRKVCPTCQKSTLSIRACIGTNPDRQNLEMIVPKKPEWLFKFSDVAENDKIAIISDAKYQRLPVMRDGQAVQWIQKITTDVNFQVITEEVFNKLNGIRGTIVCAKIMPKRNLENLLVRALNEQNIYALQMSGSQIMNQAEHNWRKYCPDEEIPSTRVMHIEMSPFYKLISAIGYERLNEICPDWERKRNDLRDKISERNRSCSERLVEQNNNTRGDNMRCSLCNSIIDENNKVVNEAEVCQRCIYGEMCPECKRNGMPTCPDCLINYGKQKNKLETTLFKLNSNRVVKRYHDPEDSFIKNTKLRMPDEKPYLYYGIELEMCIPFDSSVVNFTKEMLKAGKGLFVAENDSSLDNGVEFISRPLSYKRWKSQEVQQILGEMRGIAIKYGYNLMSQDSAGMHIHLSSLFFQKNTNKSRDEQIDDLNWIIQNYEKELRPITGRKPGNYNRSMFTNIENDLKSFIESRNLKQATITTKMDKARVPIDHHSMVSMSGLGNTVEIRAFKGTCDPLTIMARIELCRNLAHFARKYDIENMTLDKAFNCKQSPFLEKFVKENKIKVDSKKKLKSSQNIKIEVKAS